jgi:hypothetical protein
MTKKKLFSFYRPVSYYIPVSYFRNYFVWLLKDFWILCDMKVSVGDIIGEAPWRADEAPWRQTQLVLSVTEFLETCCMLANLIICCCLRINDKEEWLIAQVVVNSWESRFLSFVSRVWSHFTENVSYCANLQVAPWNCCHCLSKYLQR